MDKDIFIALIGAAATITAAIINSRSRNKQNNEKGVSNDSGQEKRPVMEVLTFNVLIPLILLLCLGNLFLSFMEKLDFTDVAEETMATNPDDGTGFETTVPTVPVNTIIPADTAIPLAENDTIANTPVGKTVLFGQYQQDKISDVSRDIEWIVLKREEDRVLLFSVLGLDTQQYNKSKGATSWELCSVREWLNGSFYDAAFNDEEKTRILYSPIKQDDNPGDSSCEQGPDTEDYVFLLSAVEYTELVYDAGNIAEEYRPGKPTSRIKKNVDIYGPEQYCWSLLRTSASDNKNISSITAYGEIDYYSREAQESGGLIRPAIWVSIN